MSCLGYSVDPGLGGKSLYSPPTFSAKPTFGFATSKNDYTSNFGTIPSQPLKPIYEDVADYRSPSPVKSPLVERFHWRFVDYAFPTEDDRQAALAQGSYVPENNLPVGIEVWNNKIFVSVPRWGAGMFIACFEQTRHCFWSYIYVTFH